VLSLVPAGARRRQKRGEGRAGRVGGEEGEGSRREERGEQSGEGGRREERGEQGGEGVSAKAARRRVYGWSDRAASSVTGLELGVVISVWLELGAVISVWLARAYSS
jgi:hypothetical protein